MKKSLSWLADNREVGVALILFALVADVVLILAGHAVPAVVTSVAMAGIGLVTGSIVQAPQSPPSD